MIALDSKNYPLSNGSSIPKIFFQDLENRFSIPVSNGMESKAARDAKKVARVKYQYWDLLETPEKSA